MNKNRLMKLLAAKAGLILLITTPWLARAQSPPPVAAPPAHRDAAQPPGDSMADDFAGLNYTDEQKAQIDKIRQESATRKEMVVKDQKLTPDQKDAMLVGYTRIEYGAIYRVLSPEQQRQVRQKNRARRAADQAAKQKK